MGRKASIGGEITLGTRKAKQALRDVRNDIRKFADDVGKMKVPQVGGGAMVGKFTEINAKATAARNVVQQAYDIVKAPAAANAWYSDLADGLTAVMGNAAAAKTHLGQLRLISDEQSLSDEDFESLVNYSIRLQSLGHTAAETADFLRELANAGEGMGKSVSAFEGLIMALDKSGQSAEASLKSIMALSKETPALRKVLEAAFGTSVAAEIEAMELSSEQLFQGILRGMKMLETARPSKVEEGLSIEQRKMQTMGADSEDNNGELAERRQLTEKERAEEIAKLEKQRAAAAAQKAAEAAEAAEKELARRRELAALESDLALAEAKGDADFIAAAEDRLDVMRDAAELARELGISESDAAEFITRQNAMRREGVKLEREAADAKERAEKAGSRAAESEDLEIEKLRSRGKNRQAERLEKARFLRDEKARLKGEGYSDADAERMAGERQQAQEDAAYFERTGRRKVRGAASAAGGGGLDGVTFDRLAGYDERGRKSGDPSDIPGFKDTVTQKQMPGWKRVRDLQAEQRRIEAQRAERSQADDTPMLQRLDTIAEELRGLRASLNGSR